MDRTQQKIIPCLWYDDQAVDAANFYVSLFKNSEIKGVTTSGKEGYETQKQKERSVLTVDFSLSGRSFVGLNGGPHFRFTPAVSFFVECGKEEEVDRLWKALSEEGEVLMSLDRYEWSEKYGWVADRFGLTWQLALSDSEKESPSLTPLLTYTKEGGEAEEAIRLYTSLFEDYGIDWIMRYESDEAQPQGTVKHCRFYLNGETFMAMDTSPEYADFTFNEAVSLVVECETQEEIDHFWEGLGRGGDPHARQCGWLKDRFGVSWQVTPVILHEMLKDSDADKVARVTEAYMEMKKFDIKALKHAYKGNQAS